MGAAPAGCESCGARAEVVLADGSMWCAECHASAWRYDRMSGRHVDDLEVDDQPDAAAAAGDVLVEDGDPYVCGACLEVGEPCGFHRAWAAGWDACAAFMAAVVNDRAVSRPPVAGGCE